MTKSTMVKAHSGDMSEHDLPRNNPCAQCGTLIPTPKAQYKLLSSDPEILWVGITPGKDGQPEYSMGKGEGGQGTSYPSRDEMLKALETTARESERPANCW